MTVTPFGWWGCWWEWVHPSDGGGDEGLVVVGLWWSGGLSGVARTLERVVGSWAVSSLLEPPGDGPVVFEGVIQMHPHLCLYQSVMDPFLGMVPLGPILAQLPVSFF